jgi:uncharacterized protein
MNHLRGIALRLVPREDLKGSLQRLVRERQLDAACVVSCAGSLRSAALRFAGRDRETRIEGPLEILSLTGTLSPEGLHLHLCVADGEGRVLGGHLLEGCEIATTAEIVVAALPELRFRRRTDPDTGYPELEIEEKVTEPDPALLTP